MRPEGLRRDGQICMHRLPVAEEGLVVDLGAFAEEDRHFDGFLEVGARLVVELAVGELVVDLVEGHGVDIYWLTVFLFWFG